MRKTFIAIGILLLLVAMGVGFFRFNYDSTAKKIIEHEGSAITNVEVNVAQVYFSAQTGDGRAHDLMIANPPLYHTPYAFSFPDINFKMDLPSLSTHLFIVSELHFNAPNINIEQTAKNNNIQMIQANIKAYVDAHMASQDSPVRRFIIESLTIENAKLNVSAPMIQPDLVTIPLPDIAMTNIGKEQGGLTSAEIVKVIMAQVNIQIAQAIKSRGLESMIDISELAPQTISFKDRIRNFFRPLIDAD